MEQLFTLFNVIVAYVAVLVLFSIVVTAIVQGVQSYWRLRLKALKVGVSRSAESLSDEIITYIATIETQTDISVEEAIITIKQKWPVISRLIGIEQKDARQFSDLKALKDEVTQQLEKLLGQDSSKSLWMSRDAYGAKVESVLASVSTVGIEESVEKGNEKVQAMIQRGYDTLEVWSNEIFVKQVRAITIAASIFVAFVFQLDTPHLLARLSVDEQTRGKIVEAAVSQFEKNAQQRNDESKAEDYRQIVTNLIGQQKDEKIKAVLSENLESIADSESEQQVRNTIKEALEDFSASEVTEVINQLDETLSIVEQKKLDNITDEISQISLLVTPFGISTSGFKTFYFKPDSWQPRFSRILGTLLTAFLLTFGAPFWFEVLKNMINLKNRATNLLTTKDPEKP
ncbi:hypothetical protein [Pleionea sp. CnH1-48]|uniref:hypothetical protein n=1 Tax=Pleionea sp. CnH1-48 TaxID=2954494 RepID=UPI002097F86E|nr:hypothetical protein [Pleionea sp. CnH1-48]MCO7223471.1 hypothetical protein [Pleionea sp. CnH1-48]